MKYHFKVHEEDSGFWAECVEIDGCYTQGDTMEELKKNMKEVLELCLEEDQTGIIEPFPLDEVPGTVEVAPDPRIALSLAIRHARRKRNLSQAQAKDMLGIKHLTQYQRVEKGLSVNLEIMKSILEAFEEISIDQILVGKKPGNAPGIAESSKRYTKPVKILQKTMGGLQKKKIRQK